MGQPGVKALERITLPNQTLHLLTNLRVDDPWRAPFSRILKPNIVTPLPTDIGPIGQRLRVKKIVAMPPSSIFATLTWKII